MTLLSLTLLHNSASAKIAPDPLIDEYESCQMELRAASPVDGSLDVPINVVVAFELTDPDCRSSEWLLSLYKGQPRELVQQERVLGTTGLIELVPVQQLEPLTIYTVTAEDASVADYPIESRTTTFLTGSATFAADLWDVTIPDYEATFSPYSNRLYSTVSVDLPTDQPESTFVRVGWVSSSEAEIQEYRVGAGGGGETVEVQVFGDVDGQPLESCVRAQGRNLDGSWTSGVTACIVPELSDYDPYSQSSAPCGGCAQTSAAAGYYLSVVALLVAFARRVRKPVAK